MTEQTARAICIGEVVIELARGVDGMFALSCGGDGVERTYRRPQKEALSVEREVIRGQHRTLSVERGAICEKQGGVKCRARSNL